MDVGFRSHHIGMVVVGMVVGQEVQVGRRPLSSI